MKRSKLLIIGPTSPPHTGMSRVTETILNSSLKDGFDLIHLDTADRRSINNMGKLDLINIGLAFKHFFQFLWLCASRKPDLVYLPIAQNVAGYLRDSLFLIPSRIFGLETVVHLNGGYFKEFYNKSNFVMKGIIRFTLRTVSGAIVLGRCLEYIFKDLVPENKIFVVPNGIEDNFSVDVKTSPKDGIFRILFLGNLPDKKGGTILLEIAPSIISSHRNVKFIFAGEWGKAKRFALEFIRKNKIADYVELIGVVEGQEKKRFLSNANIFAFPTSYSFEGQPFVILEAMSASLPIISINKGSIGETIIDGKNGFLLDKVDNTQLRKKIEELISNRSLCNEMGQASRQLYLQRYTEEIFADSLCEILSKVSKESYKALKAKQAKILILGYLPPPQEGTARMTETIIESDYLLKQFKINFMPLLKRKQATNRGRLDFENLTQNSINILNYIRFVVQFRPQIIYMPLAQNRFGFLRDSAFILVGKFFRKKVYVHFHGGSFDLFYESRCDIFKKYIRFILKHIDKLIVLADKFRKQFVPFVDIEKISFLYDCVPDITGIPSESMQKDPTEKTLKVLFIGYLSKAKGAVDIVKSIPYVLERYKKPVEFILCGQPVDTERNIIFIPQPHGGYSEIKNFIKTHNIKDKVTIKSEVVGQEKERLFKEVDIFIFPSYSEGCGLVVLEAMRYGLPVITTPVSALEEMLTEGENCFFVKPGDIRTLADRIAFLLNDYSMRQKIGQANYKLVKEKYNPDVFLRGLAQAWKGCRTYETGSAKL